MYEKISKEVIKTLYEQHQKLEKKQKELNHQIVDLEIHKLEIEQEEIKLLLEKNRLIKELNSDGRKGVQGQEEIKVHKEAHLASSAFIFPDDHL